jgi:hypothetical protein
MINKDELEDHFMQLSLQYNSYELMHNQES